MKESPPRMTIPEEARQAFATLSGPSTKTLRNTGLLPVLSNAVEVLEQIPLLMDEVAEGGKFFFL